MAQPGEPPFAGEATGDHGRLITRRGRGVYELGCSQYLAVVCSAVGGLEESAPGWAAKRALQETPQECCPYISTACVEKRWSGPGVGKQLGD